MNDNLITIVEGRVCDGILFATHRDRLLYIRTLVRNRPQWLKDNPEAWRRIEDIQREAASVAASVKSEVKVVAASSGPNGQMSSHDVGKDGNAEDTDGSADTVARGSPPAEQASATTALSLSEIAKNEIAIDGHMHVSTQRLASMLGISERTLSRLLRNGDRPPHVKIGGSYYYRLDKIEEWAVARGLRLKTPSDNH
jgi:predicted DNA-binding transcriptional regulator AlpA